MVQNQQNLEEMTLRQLRKVASLYNISRYSRMRKSQLLSAIRNIQQTSLNAPTVTNTHSSAVKTEVEASKFEVGQVTSTLEELAAVDVHLPDLPTGYGESRIVLMPRDPQWCYVYWDIPNEQKEDVRRQGGQNLALRIYDVTDINLKHQNPHNVQEYPCDELARDWYIPIPISDRDYLVEIGYRTVEGRWLTLARSGVVRVPPVYPSDWIDDQFVTVGWEQGLAGKSVHQLPNSGQASVEDEMRRRMRELEEMAEAKRMAGSLMRSQQPEESLSSYVFPSGVGRWASGMGMSGAGGQMSGAGMSGAGMSGAGMQMSGAGMSGAGMSGAGMQMSGAGMSGSGMGGNMSGIGMSGMGMMSGSGMGGNMSGAGMSGAGMMSGMGMMSGSGMGGNMSGAGMSGAGMMSGSGMGGNMSGMGMMSGSGMGGNMSGIGMSGMGMMSGSGMGGNMSGIGMMSGSGMGGNMSGIGMSGMGMMSGSGMGGNMSGIGMSGMGMMSGSGMGGNMSGIGMSGMGMMSGSGMGGNMSGAGMSGMGMMSGSGMGGNMSGIGMSGVGFSASAPPIRPRQFWLVADAELIVYGATEPNATVTIGGQPIKLNPDGTFRFQMSFQDGVIDYPIMAVAADGEQTRAVHMNFERQTPSRNTNTKEEAQVEWFEQ